MPGAEYAVWLDAKRCHDVADWSAVIAYAVPFVPSAATSATMLLWNVSHVARHTTHPDEYDHGS